MRAAASLDSERQTIDPSADRQHSLARLLLEAPFAEETNRLCLRQWRHQVFALGRKTKRHATGDEELHIRAAGEQLAERGGGVDQVLEVVEQQQHPPIRDELGQPAPCSEDTTRVRRHKL